MPPTTDAKKASTIELSKYHRVILTHLVKHGVKTEFELIQQVTAQTNAAEDFCNHEIGNWLQFLRINGMVWAGIATNRDNVGIWVAAATSDGKEMVKRFT